jgi:hypothetical protein
LKTSKAGAHLAEAVAASYRPREFQRGKFEYDRDFPPEVIAEVQDLIESLSWLLPGWCQRVRVTWYQNGSPEGTVAACGANYEYRGIDIDIYPTLLSQDDDRRREILIHEMVHGLLGPLTDYARRELKRLLPKSEAPKYRDAVLEQLRLCVESVTQDFAHTIHQREKARDGGKRQPP